MRGGFSYDVSPAKNAPIPARASATLPYENGIIKPGSRALSTASLVNRLPAPPMPATIDRDKAPSHDKRRDPARHSKKDGYDACAGSSATITSKAGNRGALIVPM
jgi:hypothetical protein